MCAVSFVTGPVMFEVYIGKGSIMFEVYIGKGSYNV